MEIVLGVLAGLGVVVVSAWITTEAQRRAGHALEGGRETRDQFLLGTLGMLEWIMTLQVMLLALILWRVW